MVDKLIVGVGEKRVVVLVYRLIVVLSECVAAMASTGNTTKRMNKRKWMEREKER
jgi:hypothetical protein